METYISKAMTDADCEAYIAAVEEQYEAAIAGGMSVYDAVMSFYFVNYNSWPQAVKNYMTRQALAGHRASPEKVWPKRVTRTGTGVLRLVVNNTKD